MTKKYTLDRIDDGFYVFLKRDDESEQLIIPLEEVKVNLNEGDIVEIETNETGYRFEVLKEETSDMKGKVSNLLEKLKNKK
ncbi:DUF3006 domain-containing protein [Sporosarcina luteola]|uniref:DUF3006 domain-containing protein n=1 Tax=Sporosarcina luteola TaxID=582850 RepID=UPI00203E5088|nr:DUF3006 domain-containing protein [Sporosarcina luteola]MCM3711056.1 DUF3006 domain-containing protein [Sporosarcina luteola]